ncbi:transcription elongation factor GreB [Candidatus Falkowbacteria bacterium]|nr:transcription elongation factor GreB [Candidatus Falkowbacteria bacterium]
MQVPVRKPGKYTHLKPDPHMTEDKFNELKAKLERLKKVSHPRAAAEVKRLAEMGDFSDNAAYSMAKGRLRGINQRVIDMEEHLKQAVIIKPGPKTGLVELGSKVTVEVNGKEKTFLILGSSETDPFSDVISRNSPVGRALLGGSVGEVKRVITASKNVEYKIVRIE